ncbi:uncharacterized protein LOC106512449, partial [Austrofundulus limnaeus]|uniref:Uncharacterized protein LOC106512449 n=1 Tax=Austrofundulus limnaeus TaxID=52670 RepID=A0A2I4ALZ6_AUSLI
MSSSAMDTTLTALTKTDYPELKTFDYTEYKSQDKENDLDPENNFFYNIGNNCCYYSTQQYNLTVNADNKFSIIHFNSRSLYANFKHIKDCLNQFKQPFSVITISENWLTPNKGADFELDGYEFSYINREGKMGGGVAVYVDNSFRYKLIENMTNVVKDHFECLTVEIYMEKNKNVIVSCIYRAPGSNMNLFIEWFEKTYTAINSKNYFICGDFNIDLLNVNNHKLTEEFINTTCSLSLFPQITRPSRITANRATLIDNIFTNLIDNTISGLLVHDISDHLPVFAVCDICHMKAKTKNNPIHKRLRTEKSINAFKDELSQQTWESVLEENDMDKAYDNFLNIFKSLYDKHCPNVEFNSTNKYSEHPWITKGLQNACKKKNKLYRDFIRQRSTGAENKYKKYKNKLTAVLRKAKQDYYSKQLDRNKNNIKGIWNILNSVIKKNSKHVSYPQHFTNNEDKHLNNMEEIVHNFNKYFVSVGPKLAEEIPQPTGHEILKDVLVRNPDSMFLTAVEENEVIDIVNKCENKRSTDNDGIDMIIIKKV